MSATGAPICTSASLNSVPCRYNRPPPSSSTINIGNGSSGKGRALAAGSRDAGADPGFLERLASNHPTPEEWASHRERLAIVEAVVARIPVGRLRFLDDLPEREIMARTGASRDAVASQLRRLRALLRTRLGE